MLNAVLRSIPVLGLAFLTLAWMGCGDFKVKPGRDYVEVGYHYEEGLRAWTVYLPHAEQDTARKVAQRYYEYNLHNSVWRFNMETSGIHSCSVQFFDSLEHTPDFSFTTALTGLQTQHQVGVFWYDKDSKEQIFLWLADEKQEKKKNVISPEDA